MINIKLKIIPNPDAEMYRQVSEAVIKNDNFCPCSLIKDETTKCLCKEFREQDTEGLCHCGKFLKILI